VGAPATRALIAAGYSSLGQLADASHQELASLHGVGPKALRIIQTALAEHGLTLA
jgi:Helix-hairpin-helix domain